MIALVARLISCHPANCIGETRAKPGIALAEMDRILAADVGFTTVLADAGYGLSAPLTARGPLPTSAGPYPEVGARDASYVAYRKTGGLGPSRKSGSEGSRSV